MAQDAGSYLGWYCVEEGTPQSFGIMEPCLATLGSTCCVCEASPSGQRILACCDVGNGVVAGFPTPCLGGSPSPPEPSGGGGASTLEVVAGAGFGALLLLALRGRTRRSRR